MVAARRASLSSGNSYLCVLLSISAGEDQAEVIEEDIYEPIPADEDEAPAPLRSSSRKKSKRMSREPSIMYVHPIYNISQHVRMLKRIIMPPP